jgi:hypothetical protein
MFHSTIASSQIVLENLSDHGQTVLNNEAIAAPTVVPQGGVFTVVDRSFRVEYVDLKGHGFTVRLLNRT